MFACSSPINVQTQDLELEADKLIAASNQNDSTVPDIELSIDESLTSAQEAAAKALASKASKNKPQWRASAHGINRVV